MFLSVRDVEFRWSECGHVFLTSEGIPADVKGRKPDAGADKSSVRSCMCGRQGVASISICSEQAALPRLRQLTLHNAPEGRAVASLSGMGGQEVDFLPLSVLHQPDVLFFLLTAAEKRITEAWTHWTMLLLSELTY